MSSMPHKTYVKVPLTRSQHAPLQLEMHMHSNAIHTSMMMESSNRSKSRSCTALRSNKGCMHTGCHRHLRGQFLKTLTKLQLHCALQPALPGALPAAASVSASTCLAADAQECCTQTPDYTVFFEQAAREAKGDVSELPRQACEVDTLFFCFHFIQACEVDTLLQVVVTIITIWWHPRLPCAKSQSHRSSHQQRTSD